MLKTELRHRYLAERLKLSDDEVSQLSLQIFRNFLTTFSPDKSDIIHCFIPLTEKNEVNTQPFFNYFFENKIAVVVPKIFDHKIIAVPITRETVLVKQKWGISEPESNEDFGADSLTHIIVPLLYADPKGNRVGYGKGFYDAFFAGANPEALKIGVNFFPPVEEIDDMWENDVPLDYLVTPTEVLSFGNGASKLTK